MDTKPSPLELAFDPASAASQIVNKALLNLGAIQNDLRLDLPVYGICCVRWVDGKLERVEPREVMIETLGIHRGTSREPPDQRHTDSQGISQSSVCQRLDSIANPTATAEDTRRADTALSRTREGASLPAVGAPPQGAGVKPARSSMLSDIYRFARARVHATRLWNVYPIRTKEYREAVRLAWKHRHILRSTH